jgi:hypothetical protein
MDDCDPVQLPYIKVIIKYIPVLSKLTITKCLLHSYPFMEISRGLKLLFVSDSHIKFHPFAPHSMQQIIMINSVVLSRFNWKADDFKACKKFAMQDCAVNFLSLLQQPFLGSSLEEFIMINVECRSEVNDCLKLFACGAKRKKV